MPGPVHVLDPRASQDFLGPFAFFLFHAYSIHNELSTFPPWPYLCDMWMGNTSSVLASRWEDPSKLKNTKRFIIKGSQEYWSWYEKLSMGKTKCYKCLHCLVQQRVIRVISMTKCLVLHWFALVCIGLLWLVQQREISTTKCFISFSPNGTKLLLWWQISRWDQSENNISFS